MKRINFIISLKNILRNKDYRIGSIYGISSLLASLISMVTGIIIIRWIEPSQLGIWQSLTIIQLYLPFLEVGIPNGLNRELPFQYGQGNKEKGVELAQTAQFYMIGNAFLLFAGTLLVVPILYFFAYDLKVVTGALAVGLMASMTTYDRYLTVTFRSAQSFLELSKIQFIRSIAQLILFPIVYFYNYYGLLLYSFLVLFVFVVLKHFNRPILEGPKWDKESFFFLIKTGLPVFGMGYLRGISNSFTRIVLLMKGSVLQVGLFTPVNAVGAIITILPGILSNYFFPKMNIRLGQSNDPTKLWPMVVKLNGIMMVLSIPFVIGTWLLTPYFMNFFFEKYTSATLAMQLFSLNMIFAGTLISHNVIYAVKAYKLGYIFTFVEFCLRFICPYLLVVLFSGNILTLTSIGVLISNLLLFVLNIILIRFALFTSKL